MLGIDKYPYQSKLLKVDPREKVFFSVVFLVLIIGFSSFVVSLFGLATMILITLFKGGMKGKNYFPLFLIPMTFLVVGTLTIMVTQIPTGSPYILGISIGDGFYGLSWDSLKSGLNLILKAISAVSVMYFLALTTPLKDILYVLRKVKVPALVIELMELIYRFVFILYSESRKVHTAQASRLGYGTFRNSIKSLGTLGSMLFLRGFKRSDKIYNALESRGYTGDIVLLADEYESNKKNYGYTILLACIFIAIGLLEKRFVIW